MSDTTDRPSVTFTDFGDHCKVTFNNTSPLSGWPLVTARLGIELGRFLPEDAERILGAIRNTAHQFRMGKLNHND